MTTRASTNGRSAITASRSAKVTQKIPTLREAAIAIAAIMTATKKTRKATIRQSSQHNERTTIEKANSETPKICIP